MYLEKKWCSGSQTKELLSSLVQIDKKLCLMSYDTPDNFIFYATDVLSQNG